MCDVQDIKTSLNFPSNGYEQKYKNVSSNINTKRVLSTSCIRDLHLHEHMNTGNEEIKKAKLFLYENNVMLKVQKEKVMDLEYRSRRNNLRIDELKENEKQKLGHDGANSANAT